MRPNNIQSEEQGLLDPAGAASSSSSSSSSSSKGKGGWTNMQLALAGLLVVCAVVIPIAVVLSDNGSNNKDESVEVGNPFDQFLSDPENPHLYRTGEHRRATDPMSTEEIDIVTHLFFGPRPAPPPWSKPMTCW